MIALTIIEITAVVLLVLGLIFEKKLIALEDKLLRATKRAIRRRRARKEALRAEQMGGRQVQEFKIQIGKGGFQK